LLVETVVVDTAHDFLATFDLGFNLLGSEL